MTINSLNNKVSKYYQRIENNTLQLDNRSYKNYLMYTDALKLIESSNKQDRCANKKYDLKYNTGNQYEKIGRAHV